MKILVTILMLLTTTYTFANTETLIEDKNIISELSEIQASLDEVTIKVMACLDSGGEYSWCLCDNKEIINSFNKRTLLFFKNNESFKNVDLVRFKLPSGEWLTQSLQGILKQASAGTPACT